MEKTFRMFIFFYEQLTKWIFSKKKSWRSYKITCWSMVVIIITRCAMFTDDFQINPPAPLITTVHYPGILSIALVSEQDMQDNTKIKNYLVVQNVGNNAITATELLVEVFLDNNHTHETRVRSERLKTITALQAGETDSIKLQGTFEYIQHRKNIEVALLHAAGAQHLPMSGCYQGTFITYKNGELISGGTTRLTIDINGKLDGKLQAPNEFNRVSGTVTPDSLVFSTLKKNDITVRNFQTTICPMNAGTGIQLNFIVQNDAADSTRLTLQKTN